MVPRLLENYRTKIIPAVQEKFSVKNPMAVPRLDKIVINMGIGEATGDLKILEKSMEDLMMIAGQKPIMRRAKIAISNFKLKEKVPIGCKVTLRRLKMYEFLDRLLNATLPRIRDFNGVPKYSFDKRGNYNLGITDHAIFPEIETGKIQRTQGMDIAFVFNKGPKEQTFEILRLLGMPFGK